MSGDHGTPGVQPGRTAALQQRPYSHANQQPRVAREQQGRQQTELGAAGLSSRLIHRAAIFTMLVGTSAALGAWVVALVWGALWIWGQLPLV